MHSSGVMKVLYRRDERLLYLGDLIQTCEVAAACAIWSLSV